MNIYKRNNLYWIKLTDYEKEILGKEKNRFSLKVKNKKHAEEYKKELKEKVIIKKNQVETTNKPAGKILFSEVLEKYIEYKKNIGEELNIGTIHLYDLALKHFYKALPDKIIDSYDKKDYNTFLYEMKNLAQNTKAIYTSRINALFNYLVKEDYLEKNYFRIVKEEKKKTIIVTDDQVNQLINYAKKTKFYEVVMLMKIGAFRASEAISITNENIKNEHIEIIGKGNKAASIPIINEMKEFLSTKPKFEQKINYVGVRKFFQRASKKLGFKIKSHDLRKYQLSRLANAGVNIYFVKNYARHSDIKTTLKYYAIVDLDKMRNEIDKILGTMEGTKRK